MLLFSKIQFSTTSLWIEVRIRRLRCQIAFLQLSCRYFRSRFGQRTKNRVATAEIDRTEKDIRRRESGTRDDREKEEEDQTERERR